MGSLNLGSLSSQFNFNDDDNDDDHITLLLVLLAYARQWPLAPAMLTNL